MSSMLIREARWFLANVAIILCWLFALAIAQAAWRLAVSGTGSIGEGWSGDPLMQVVGWAVLGAAMGAAYSPLLLLVLVPYRAVARVLGHPRLAAVAIAAILTGAVAAATQPADPGWIAFLAVFSIGCAVLLRLPGQDLRGLPPLARGAVAGFSLSVVWLVGSVVAIAWGGCRVSRGASAEGGAILVAGTALPGVLLFADLFRDGVPELNYAVTALLLGGTVTGLAALVLAASRRGAAAWPPPGGQRSR